MSEHPEYVSTGTVAKHFGVRISHVCWWINQGHLPARRINVFGQHPVFRIKYADMIAFVPPRRRAKGQRWNWRKLTT